MLDKEQLRTLVHDTLDKIGLSSDKADALVFNTGMVESKYVYLKQIKGPARGLYQCEPWVAVDVCKNYLKYREELMKSVASACYLDWKYFTAPNEQDWGDILTYNIAAQIAMCRLHYRRVPKPLPGSLLEQAKYWKVYYNSAKGRGTVDHFVKLVEQYG